MKRLVGLCLTAVAATLSLNATPIGFVFRTDPSTISSDLNGDGIEETFANLTTTTDIKMWFGEFNQAGLSAPDQSRHFYSDSFSFEGMYLDPVKQTVSGTNYIYDSIGGSFDENLYASGNGTHLYSGKRIDQSMMLSWGQSYSNDVVDWAALYDPPCPFCMGNYVATLDLFHTLLNISNDPRGGNIYFSFTTVWSDPNTYNYEKHSTWSGTGHIVSVFDEGATTGAVPEPSTWLLVSSALAVFPIRWARRRLIKRC
jgi:hypothetical protein